MRSWPDSHASAAAGGRVIPCRLSGSALTLSAALLPLSTFGAGQAPEAELGAVVITGERLARTRSQTASSVSVVPADEMERFGVERVEQMLAYIPNVRPGSGTEGPTFRGQDSTGVLRDLPAFLGGARPRVTLQVDGRAVGFNEFIFGVAPTWDVEQVEVFRTPQATTQGRNSIGGAIFVTTRDPGPWEARARLLSGNQDLWQGSFAVSAPLAAEQLSLRVAGDLRRGHPASHIADVYPDADPTRDDHELLRVKLLAKPAALAGLRLLTTYTHTGSRAPQIEGVGLPFSDRKDPSPGYGVFETRVDSLTVDARHPLSAHLQARAIVSAGDARIDRDARQVAGRYLGKARTDTRDVSLETLLDYSPAATLRLAGGIHLLSTRLDQQIDLSAVLGAGGFDDHQRSRGVFGEISLGPASGWTLTAGLRYQQDLQDRGGQLTSSTDTYRVDFDGRFSGWMPRLSITHTTPDGLTVGLLAQHAHNPGGTSYDFNQRMQRDFDSERLWNYEAFARADLAGGRAHLDFNIFHARARDAQRALTRLYSVPGAGTATWAEVINVPRTRSQGMEAALTWLPARAWRLQVGVGLLDTRIADTPATPATLRAKQFQRAPGNSAFAGAEWQPGGRWRLNLMARRHADYYSDDFNTAALRVRGATVVDAGLRYARHRWSVSAYARNLFDEFYLTSQLNARLATAGDPREFGVALEVGL
jgi:iron complex outermembrane recepter protein